MKTNSFLIGMLFLSVFFFSCDTEYIDKVNTIPGDVIQVPGYTHIESFTLKDTENNTIQAAITEENIIVTWSNHIVMPKKIKPEIILGTEAVITPASGTEIPFKDGEVYTVTSKAGTTKKYTLKIDLRQKEPTAWNFEYGSTLIKSSLLSMTNPARGGSNSIDNLWLKKEQTRVFLVAATDQKTEYTAETVYVGTGTGVQPFANYGAYYFLPDNIPAGMYELRIKNGAYTIQNASVENRYKMEVVEPTTFKVELYGTASEKQAGDTFEVRGGLLNTVTSVQMYNSAAATVIYTLEVVSATAYKVVLKIPAGTPAGTYNRMRFYRGTASTLSAYTITVK
ncbi:hypothetical protein ACFSJW_18160 [Flavobacterium artemisiae]|uniref:DUF5018 domain-containing protein n=1 Tax=Flavobacterium artemisiae TaxID=2126556 RepID=A0ABW4H9T1_9FLAO